MVEDLLLICLGLGCLGSGFRIGVGIGSALTNDSGNTGIWYILVMVVEKMLLLGLDERNKE
jgi:hypothetical protein